MFFACLRNAKYVSARSFFRAITLAKIVDCTLIAWSRFCSAADRHRLHKFIRRCIICKIRFFCAPDSPTDTLFINADIALFRSLLNYKQLALRNLLSPTTQAPHTACANESVIKLWLLNWTNFVNECCTRHLYPAKKGMFLLYLSVF